MKRVTYKTKTCDLHGMTLEKAKNYVESFINQCIAEDVKKAFIVTGSDNHTNNPVLCRQIPDKETDAEIFASALEATGGNGEVSEKNKKIIHLYSKGEIDYETASFAIERSLLDCTQDNK